MNLLPITNHRSEVFLKMAGKIAYRLLLAVSAFLFFLSPVLAESPPHGVLRIGIFPFEPINFVDDQGHPKGLFPSLLQEIAKSEGWVLNYVSGSWAEGLERLQNHEIDLMISVAYSEERAKIMDYTHESALELWGQVFVTPKNRGVNISDLEGQLVGVMYKDISGKNFIKTATEMGVSFAVREYSTFAEVFTGVESGEVAAGVAPQHFGLRHGDKYSLVPSSIQFSPFSIYFAAKKGQHHSFLSTIDAYLFRWKQDKNSFYYQQLGTWLGGGDARRLPVWFLPSLILGSGITLLLFVLSLLFKSQVKKATTGLAESNRALEESRERYRFLYVNAQGGLYKCRIEDGKLLECNLKFAELLGYQSREECLEKCVLENHYADPQVRKTFVQSLSGDGQIADLEAEFIRYDGKKIWLRFVVKVNLSEGVFESVAIDITLNKTIEKTLYFASQKNWFVADQTLFSSLVTYLAETLNLEYAFIGRTIEQGTRVRTIGLYAEGEIVPDVEYDLKDTPCDDVFGKSMCVFSGGIQGAFPEDLLLVEMQVESYAGLPLWNAEGDPIGLLSVMGKSSFENVELVKTVLQLVSVRAAHELERIDYIGTLEGKNRDLSLEIEQRIDAEADLRDSEQRYASLNHQFEVLLDSISDPLVLMTEEMQPVWTNQAYEQICSELGVDNFLNLFQLGASGQKSPILTCLEQERVVEEMLMTPDQRMWGVKVFPLLDIEKQIKQVIAIAVDITEKVRLREEASRAARLASLGELAAGIAHEINNPNAVVLLNMPIIRDVFTDAEEILRSYFEEHGDLSLAGIDYQDLQQELPVLIDRVQESALRIKRIVEDLKNFVRDEGPKSFEQVDLNRVVETAVRLLQNSIKKSTSHFQVELLSDLPLVQGDFQKLEQVAINLIQNACQALTDSVQAVQVETGYLKETSELVLRVRDQGRGIDQENLTRLTDPFFTTKRGSGGTGLGLSVSERILQEHQARLEIESELGEGSVFSVFIPVFSKGE